MQNIFINIKCSEIILSNANENWYIILYDLFSWLCYIATCGPFCKDATHILCKINLEWTGEYRRVISWSGYMYYSLSEYISHQLKDNGLPVV